MELSADEEFLLMAFAFPDAACASLGNADGGNESEDGTMAAAPAKDEFMLVLY